MHAAVLADQPLQIALRVVPFGEPHQRPGAGTQVERIVVGPLEVADFGAQIVPLHARRLAGLAADAARHVDQLRDLRPCRAAAVSRPSRRSGGDVERLDVGHLRSPSGDRRADFSTFTRNALNSGVSAFASPTNGVSTLAPKPMRAWPVKPQWIGMPMVCIGLPSTIIGFSRLVT